MHEEDVFFSWSGGLSKEIAESLTDWLPLILDSPKYWLSSRNISPGTRWLDELNQKLETTDLGVLVITSENLNSSWMHFEAGALSKKVNESKLIPLLLGLEPHQLKGPLSSFQAILANQEGIRKLVLNLNEVCKNPLDENIILQRFELSWPLLEKQFTNIQSRNKKILNMGLQQKNESKHPNLDFKILQDEIASLKEALLKVVMEVGGTDKDTSIKEKKRIDTSLNDLEGAYINRNSKSHLYIKVINEKIIAPYCYRGNNKLTGEYYNWKKVGDSWFTRFRWFGSDVKGFAIYSIDSNQNIVGNWWIDERNISLDDIIEKIGKRKLDTLSDVEWIRQKSLKIPIWAKTYFKEKLS